MGGAEAGRAARREALHAAAKRLPKKPGVYKWISPRGKVVYVGKSIDLRSRVLSYFGGSPSTPAKARRIVDASAELDFFVTDTEADALILERRQIRKYKPRFNVVFRDDKSYPMIKITREEFPRIMVTRQKLDDGAVYLGPYPSAGAVRRTLKLLTTLFPLRDCHFSSERLVKVPVCLSYHIKRCAGPCEAKVDPDEYRALARDAARFLQGDTDEVIAELEAKMEAAAAGLEFERAALYRDRLDGLRRMSEKRRVAPSGTPFDEDVVAVARGGGVVVLQEIHYRKGRMEGQRRDHLRTDAPLEEVLAEWLGSRYLVEDVAVPGAVLLSHEPAGQGALEEALRQTSGRAVELAVPQRGRRWEMVQMALRNCHSWLESRRGEGPGEDAAARLAEVLELPQAPARIEAFDISNLGEVEKVASMVVALDGRMAKAEYRRFVIKTVKGQDDFASMAEVIRRRYRRVASGELEPPDLVLVDGGPGQVSAAREVLVGELGLGDLPLIGLAKKEERIVRPGDTRGMKLPVDHPARLLLQAIRDEAHRFALALHRKRRGKRSLRSELDEVPGVGPASKRALLRHFQDLPAVRAATLEELLAVDGLPRRAAEALFDYYRSVRSGTLAELPKE